LDLGDALTLKGDDITSVKDFAMKDPSFRIQLHMRRITFVLKHDLLLLLGLDARSDEKPAHGLERPLVGLFPRMGAVKYGTNAVEINSNTRPTALTDLSAECLEEALDVRPKDTGKSRLDKDSG
jgi:hypothetical protein